MEKKDNGYILPMLGALVGGLVATLPWILSYVYAETMWSILAIFIAIVALKDISYFMVKSTRNCRSLSWQYH